jgi:acyl-CoA reductase-like NAD-dependent aldehyde dehydrogenase
MLKVLSPFDQSLIKELPLSNKNDLESSLSKAHSLFLNNQLWLEPHQRIKILEHTVELMKIKKSELIDTAVKEGGKPYLDTQVEVLRAINGVKLAIEGISQLKGEQVPMGLTPSSINRISFTTTEPIGVVAAISAFNHPVNLIVHQVITAIAAGCPVIVKPALTTPLSCLALVNILEMAGLPEGWCQVLICENEIAEKLATDKRIKFLSFIGSSKVGWRLRSKLSPGTKCVLEHGGAAPVIIEPDADMDTLLPSLLKGAFSHAGQICVSVQRVFAQGKQAIVVAERLAEMAKNLTVGNPINNSTEVGPLILPQEVDRIEQWVNEAIHEGATLLSGGRRISDSCYAPTVLLNPTMHSKVSCLEIFGPVVCIYSVSSTEEAIEKANSIDVHFQASVFTKNIDQALNVVTKLNASTVMVNDHTAFRVDWMPFGGKDSSGIGVGGIQYSMKEMTREKLVVIKSMFI